MKRKRMQGWLSAGLLVASLWSGTPAFASNIGDEVKIDVSQPEIAKTGFDISEDYAVWMVEGSKAITLYDLDKSSELNIGSADSTKVSPRVDGNYVVWIDSRDGGSDVYLYDISKKKESRLTSGAAKVSSVEIAGKNVVWDDKSQGSSNIYLYNLTSGSVEQVSTSGKASSPAVSDAYVTWQDERNGNTDIYYYDLKAKKEKAAVTARGNQVNPSIYAGQILYEDQSSDNTQIALYTINKNKTKKLTSDSNDKEMTHIYKDTYVFLKNGDAFFGNINKTSSKEIASFVYDKLPPRIYGDYVLYAKLDNDKHLRLNLYDADEKKTLPLGAVAGEPSQPDGHDHYVVYISEGEKNSSVILYDAESGSTKVISKGDADPTRPLVSNSYVVWYDSSVDALMAYDIAEGTTTQVTDEDDDQEPDKKLYELDGSNLLWVNTVSKSELVVTDLSESQNTEIASLKKDPLSIDIYGNYVTWVLEQSSNKANISLYNIEEEDETVIRKNVQVKEAKLGDEFVVWSEYTNTSKPTWDLYYYDIDRSKASSLLRYNQKDQIDPQVSRNMVLFKDNRLSPKAKDYYYELYDAEDGSYSEFDWDDEAEMEQARIGGNRIVWIDTRDETPYVYTMTIGQPQEDE